MQNKLSRYVATRKADIRVEIDRWEYDPTSISYIETNSHNVLIGIKNFKIFEEEVIDKILDCSLNVYDYFERNKEIQTLKIFIDNDLVCDCDRDRK